MSKKRIPQKTIEQIGAARITRLLDLSEQAVRDGNTDRARRYVEIARRVGMKTRVPMPRDRRFCKGCLVPLMPGTSCTVRLSGHKIVTTCGMCGKVRRQPYIREQRR